MRVQGMILAGVLGAVACAGSTGEVGAVEEEAEELAATVEVKLREDSVAFLLHVTNPTSRALAFTFPTSQRYDFVVRDEMGAEVWRWSEGMMFLQAISHATLGPGETWEFEVAWEPGNRSGRHEVVARVTAAEQEVEQRATFDLP